MKQQKKPVIVFLLLLTVFLSVAIGGNHMLTTAMDQKEKNATEVKQLESEIAQFRSQIEDLSDKKDTMLTAEEKEGALYSATEVCEAIATYQNAYATIDAMTQRDAFDENVAKLDGYFTNENKNARVPWYFGVEKGTWRFVSDGSFRGDTLSVVWVCESDADGGFLAYATGIYHSDTKQVSDVVYQMTSDAASQIPAEGEEGDDSLTVEDLPIDAVNEVDTSHS